MHSKVNKMRFQRLNNKSNGHQDYENDDDEVFKSDGEETTTNLNHHNLDTSDMLTLEGLRRTYNSCSNCGVSWYDDHVSLDCSECGGYALCRPCPTCNGQCGNVWRRDVKASHVSKHAEWHGACSMPFQWSSLDKTMTTADHDTNANFHNGSYHHHRSNLNRTSSETHVM